MATNIESNGCCQPPVQQTNSCSNCPLANKLSNDVASLKKTKQDVITAGGNSMILTRGSIDGELGTLYRKDIINEYNPNVANVPSEPAVVNYVEDKLHTLSQQVKKTITNTDKATRELLDEEKNRATNAETELRTRIDVINPDALKTLISTETTRATQAEKSLEDKIKNETTRAARAEDSINQALDREISRASDVEGNLTHAIADEKERAKAAEKALSDRILAENTGATDLQQQITIEKNRAEAAEKSLDSKYTALIDTLKSTDDKIRTDLSNEITRASGAESAMDVKLENEIARAKAEEKKLESLVGGIDYTEKLNELKEKISVAESVLGKQIEDEFNRANKVEADIRLDLNTEIERSSRQDERAVADLQAEITRAKRAEETVGTKLDEEIARSTAADNTLDGKIASEITRATTVENAIYKTISDLADSISDGNKDNLVTVAELNKKVTDEIDRSIAADNLLTTNLTSEVERAKAAEAKNATDIAVETVRAQEAENGLNRLITNEIEKTANESKRVDKALSDMESHFTDVTDTTNRLVSHEIDRAQIAENDLDTKITNEIGRARESEDALNTAISNEVIRAKAQEEDTHRTLVDEITRSSTEDTRLAGLIEAAENHVTEIETGFNRELGLEVTRAKDAEQHIIDMINDNASEASRAISEIDEKKVDKSHLGAIGNVVRDTFFTISASDSAVETAKQLEVNKTTVNLEDGTSQTSVEKFDIGTMSGVNEIAVKLAMEENRAIKAEDELRKDIIKKTDFANTNFSVVTSQEFVCPPVVSDALFKTITISKDIRDAGSKRIDELYVLSDDLAMVEDMDAGNGNTKVIKISVVAPTDDEFDDMLKRVFG